jgi:hypothetical protein
MQENWGELYENDHYRADFSYELSRFLKQPGKFV